MNPQTFESEIGGRKLIIESGRIAGQAEAAVTVRYGESVVLVTVCVAPEPREGVDFLPLTIDYEERLYAAGKIPGGFIRREGRPTTTVSPTFRSPSTIAWSRDLVVTTRARTRRVSRPSDVRSTTKA